MNPSYTNEVGASAGNFAGAPMGSGAQGAPMGSEMQGAPVGTGMQGAPVGTGAFGSSSSQAGGDIILGAPKKKSRKWLIFLILGIILIVAVAIIAVFFVAKNANEKQTVNATNTAFSQFASFLTTGNESDAFPTNEYNSSTYYSLERAIIDDDRDYFETANQLFDVFIGKVNPAAGSVEESVVSFYKTDWPMIYAYGKYHFYSEEDFFNYYLENGAATTRELATAEYQAYIATDYEYADTVAEAYLAYAEYMLESMNIIENAGCITNGSIDETCVAAITTNQEQIDAATENIADKDAADQIMESIVRNFIQELWTFTEATGNE